MIIIADTGPIISLAIIDKLNLLAELYGEIYIPDAVWKELVKYADVLNVPKVRQFKNNIKYINSENYLSSIMDDGESEAVILYKEMNADSFFS
jgi:predicted nucleic acid-binding protein